MTREKKIQNIIEATTKLIEEEVNKGTMTTEKYISIMESQNLAILEVNRWTKFMRWKKRPWISL